jgi:L-fucose mutarotase
MRRVPADEAANFPVPIYDDFQKSLDAGNEGQPVKMELIERFAFYERAKKCFAVVQTGERRQYGNIIIKKGVIRADE